MLLTIPWFQFEPISVPLPLIHSTIDLQPFGLLVWIGTVLGILLALRIAREQVLDDFLIRDLIFHCVLYGFIGAYLLNALFYEWDQVLAMFKDPHLLLSRWLGLSSVGGVLSGWFGALVWKWRRKQQLIPYIDSVSAGLTVGFFFGRIGCFMVHDHPGRVTDFFLAVANFHTGSPPYSPRHDLGLYEVIVFGVLSILFVILFRRRDLKHGLYTSFALFYYAPIRFLLDFLRAPDREGGDIRYGGFTPAQYSSLGFLLLAAWLYRRYRASAATWTDDQRNTVTPSVSGPNSIDNPL